MKRDHEFVNTVEEGSEETHSQVFIWSVQQLFIWHAGIDALCDTLNWEAKLDVYCTFWYVRIMVYFLNWPVQVKQMQVVAPLEKQFSILYAILTEHIAEDVDYKVSCWTVNLA